MNNAKMKDMDADEKSKISVSIFQTKSQNIIWSVTKIDIDKCYSTIHN